MSDVPVKFTGNSDDAMREIARLGVCPKNNLPILPIGVSKIA